MALILERMTNLNPNLVISRLHEILRQDVRLLSEERLWVGAESLERAGAPVNDVV